MAGVKVRVGQERSEVLALLTTVGTELEVRLVDGRMVFGKVVDRCQIRPWGCREPVRIAMAVVRSARTAWGISWALRQEIGGAQSRGARVVGISRGLFGGVELGA